MEKEKGNDGRRGKEKRRKDVDVQRRKEAAEDIAERIYGEGERRGEMVE